MKNVKILVSIFLLLALLAGCGGEPKDEATPPSDKVSSGENIKQAPSAEPAAEPSPEPVESAKPLRHGSVVGGTYTNETIGIGCDLDSSWTYMTDEEIAEINGIAQDIFDEADLDLSEGDRFTDMYAMTNEGLVTINVQIERLGVTSGAGLSEDVIAENIPLDEIVSMLESAGYSSIDCEMRTVDFADGTHYSIHIAGQFQGADIYQQMVYVKQGVYMATTTFTSYFEDTTDQLMEAFYSL